MSFVPRQHREVFLQEFRLQNMGMQQRKAVAGMEALIWCRECSATLRLFGELTHDEAIRKTIDCAPDLVQHLNFFH